MNTFDRILREQLIRLIDLKSLTVVGLEILGIKVIKEEFMLFGS